jgi:ubiquinone/menaquinone biosynthesis C-methylase UbiE
VSRRSTRPFTRAVSYEQARPGYPQEAVEWLIDQMAIGPSTIVVDLAAGTGKLTRALLPTGARVIAVEPERSMRTVLRTVIGHIEVVGGTAEAIPLDAASADAVTVAQAFHWFQASDALAEIHRVLRPKGSLGLIWNIRDLKQPLQAGLQAILDRYGADVPTHAATHWLEGFETTALFTRLKKRQFHWEDQRDAQRFLAFAASLSQLASLPNDTRDAALGEIQQLTADLPDQFPVRFRTDTYICTRNEARS